VKVPTSSTIPHLKFILHSNKARDPFRATYGSNGYDLFSSSVEEICLQPFTRATIPTDVQVIYPPNCYGEIVARSGLASKYGITVLAGLCDNDYTGCLFVILYNTSPDSSFRVRFGTRIAQLVIRRRAETESILVECGLESSPIGPKKQKRGRKTTKRGKLGLGSSGQK